MTDQSYTPTFYERHFVRMRYFAALNPDESGAVTLTDALSLVDIEVREGMIPIDKETFEKYSGMQNLYFENGTFVQRNPPPPALHEQAQNMLQQARSTVYQNFGMLNEPTPQIWVDYLKALAAIANGTDTESKSLPNAPSVS